MLDHITTQRNENLKSGWVDMGTSKIKGQNTYQNKVEAILIPKRYIKQKTKLCL